MVNKVIAVGRLGQDPKVTQTQSSQSVCNFSIATSERWTDKQGNRQERTEWINVVTWGRTADNCAKYLAKGRLVYIEGKLQTRKWQDQNGQDRYATEVVAHTVQFVGDAPQQQQEESDNPWADQGAGMFG